MVATADLKVLRSEGKLVRYPVEALMEIFAGTGLMIEPATGFVQPATPSATGIFAGIADEYVDNTAGAVGGEKFVNVWVEGEFEFPSASSAAQTSVGSPAEFDADDNVELNGVTLNSIPCGVFTAFVDTGIMRVKIGIL